MDKYEYSLKKTHIRQLLEKGSPEEAAEICDSIDWRHNKDLLALHMAADAYEAVGNYEKALLVLEQSYANTAQGKRIAYRITELALRIHDLQTAENYFEEFRMLAPENGDGLLLEYMLAVATKRSLEERIQILEEYKEYEFQEQWGYELAELYHQAGRQEECVRLCDEIILWFRFGPYVDRALKLKVLYAPLTEEQRRMLQDDTDYQVHLSRMMQNFAARKAQDEMEQMAEETEGFTQPLEEGEEPDFLEEESIAETEISAEVMERVNRKTAVLFGELDSSALFQEEPPVPVESLDKVQRLQEEYDAKVKEYGSVLQEQTVSPEEEYRLKEETAPELEETAAKPVTAEQEEMPADGWHSIHHFIVSSEMPAAGLHFAQGILKQMVNHGVSLPSEKTARTTAEKLNQAGLIQSIRILLGKVLVVEHAGALSDTLIGEFSLILKRPDIQLLVVFIDTEEQLNQMFARSGSFSECFSRKFVVSGYSVAELEDYAQYYAFEQGYHISDRALTAIEAELEAVSLRKDGKEKMAVEELVDNAIEKSSRRSLKKLVKSLFVLLRDEEERIYLREEDFV